MTSTVSFKKLSDWLPWLETLSPREIVLGLERVHVVLERLELHTPPMVINVTGTNGKGSSAAMLESLLRAGGSRTGCYTSPHVHRYNERICVNGEPATDEDIVKALTVVEAVRGDVPLTFFEFGTLAALVAFDNAGADTWILEVGLGGRLDAVNAIDPHACLITNVSLDHCAWLGNDRESIAREKAGIMRASTPVIFGSPDVPAAITRAANDVGAILRVAGQHFDFEEHAGEPARWTWHGGENTLRNILRPALHGHMQLQNASAVLAVLESLGVVQMLGPDMVSNALSGTRLKGRFQIVSNKCRWILDVAHNPEAARILADMLATQSPSGRTTAVVGMLADKDIAGVIQPVAAFVDQWIAVTVAGSRAASATKLAATIANVAGKPCLIADSTNEALEMAREWSSPADTVLVTGSFYLVGPALEWLGA